MLNETATSAAGDTYVCSQAIAFSLVLIEEHLETRQLFRPIDWILELLGLEGGYTMLPRWDALVGLIEEASEAARAWLTLIHVAGIWTAWEALEASEAAVDAAFWAGVA